MDREGSAGREQQWRRFVEAERAALENRRRWQLAKLLRRTLPGESREELKRLAKRIGAGPRRGSWSSGMATGSTTST